MPPDFRTLFLARGTVECSKTSAVFFFSVKKEKNRRSWIVIQVESPVLASLSLAFIFESVSSRMWSTTVNLFFGTLAVDWAEVGWYTEIHIDS